MSDVRYPCPTCGGIYEFDPLTQNLKCPNCGNEREITNTGMTDERSLRQGFQQFASSTTEEPATESIMILDCSTCGANIEVSGDSTATSCPYCGAHIVLAEKQVEVITPDGIRPFRLDKNQAGEAYRDWMKGKWLAPSELKTAYQQDKVMGIYVPYWTFDTDSMTSYSCEVGDEYQEHYVDSDGESKTRTAVNWNTAVGRFNYSFDDIPVPATKAIDTKLLDEVGPFDTKALHSYSPEYLSGYSAERHNVPIDVAYEDATERMERTLESEVIAIERRSHDRVRSVRMNVKYFNETFMLVILPIYITAYLYKSKTYNVIVNGETGRVYGEYPKSVAKILAIVLAIVLVIALIVFLYTR